MVEEISDLVSRPRPREQPTCRVGCKERDVAEKRNAGLVK
jgi:hypothetical protein